MAIKLGSQTPFHDYQAQCKDLPIPGITGSNGIKLLSSLIQILPYSELVQTCNLCADWLQLLPRLNSHGSGLTCCFGCMLLAHFLLRMSMLCINGCGNWCAGATANVICNLCQAGTYLTGAAFSAGTQAPGFNGARK